MLDASCETLLQVCSYRVMMEEEEEEEEDGGAAAAASWIIIILVVVVLLLLLLLLLELLLFFRSSDNFRARAVCVVSNKSARVSSVVDGSMSDSERVDILLLVILDTSK